MSDVVIVAADRAYPEYLKYQAYVGHPNRPYREQVRWMAFYTDKAIQREVPSILEVRQGLVFSRRTMSHLYLTRKETDWDIADLIGVLLEETDRKEGEMHHVLLLTSPEDPDTFTLPQEVRGTKTDHKGRPIPITMGQFRYTTMRALVGGPRTTDELHP